MRQLRTVSLLALALFATTLTFRCVSIAAENAAGAHHLMLTPDEIKWEPFPALGPGVERALLSGDPDKRARRSSFASSCRTERKWRRIGIRSMNT